MNFNERIRTDADRREALKQLDHDWIQATWINKLLNARIYSSETTSHFSLHRSALLWVHLIYTYPWNLILNRARRILVAEPIESRSSVRRISVERCGQCPVDRMHWQNNANILPARHTDVTHWGSVRLAHYFHLDTIVKFRHKNEVTHRP